MPNNEVTPADAVAYLNELVRLDRPAMHALVESRVPCQEALADHPTVQVVSDGEDAVVGFLGVLNGLFGTDAEGWVLSLLCLMSREICSGSRSGGLEVSVRGSLIPPLC